jgi:formamidopyrimidine-DNA glycosylase
MPEAAEVKLTTEYLSSVMTGNILIDWQFLDGQYKDAEPPGFDEFSLPVVVVDVECKGKTIYMTFADEDRYYYCIHSMRMTGSWRDSAGDSNETAYPRWYIELAGGGSNGENKKLWFHDPRTLGTLFFTSDENELKTALNKLGPDILTEHFTLPIWKQLIQKHSNKNITAFLMDQSIIAGCGNYIKSEALYEAKISPLRKIGSLSENEIEALYHAIRLIPRLAYNNRGLSLHDYVDHKGRKGNFEFQLKVYSKTSVGKNVVKRITTADGRSTYWDPQVQK